MGKKTKRAVSSPPAAVPPPPSPLSLAKNGSVLIHVTAKPGANMSVVTNYSEVGRVVADSLKSLLCQDSVTVSIAAPPVDGEANTTLVKYFSQILGVKKSDICLESGARGRNKVVSVSGTNLEEVEKKIKDNL